ncbi:DUF393 domain-containing protein, partial [bacterium]|nr:DUF393 domain-containing protein [bacterium]
SEAVLHVLLRLGGARRVVGAVLRWVPGRLRDAGYDGVARARHRVFARRTDPATQGVGR